MKIVLNAEELRDAIVNKVNLMADTAIVSDGEETIYIGTSALMADTTVVIEVED